MKRFERCTVASGAKIWMFKQPLLLSCFFLNGVHESWSGNNYTVTYRKIGVIT